MFITQLLSLHIVHKLYQDYEDLHCYMCVCDQITAQPGPHTEVPTITLNRSLKITQPVLATALPCLAQNLF